MIVRIFLASSLPISVDGASFIEDSISNIIAYTKHRTHPRRPLFAPFSSCRRTPSRTFYRARATPTFCRLLPPFGVMSCRGYFTSLRVMWAVCLGVGAFSECTRFRSLFSYGSSPITVKVRSFFAPAFSFYTSAFRFSISVCWSCTVFASFFFSSSAALSCLSRSW